MLHQQRFARREQMDNGSTYGLLVFYNRTPVLGQTLLDKAMTRFSLRSDSRRVEIAGVTSNPAGVLAHREAPAAL